jgi:AraC-like DNA-binding protein
MQTLAARTPRRHRLPSPPRRLKIEALALELGFRHAASFAREFKSIVGVSPSAYLEKEKSRFFIPPP